MAGAAFLLWMVMGFTPFWTPRDVCGIETCSEDQRKLAYRLQALNHQMCPFYTGGPERGHRTCFTLTWPVLQEIGFVPVSAGGGFLS